MFANKNKIFSSILLSLLLIGSSLAFSSSTHATDTGQDFLAGIGCDDTNKDGSLNFFDDCLSGDDNGSVTSFTDFKGDLTPPNPEGYASGLTQAQDARTFILNVTNFALGFLGLIAVLVVIYGGVLSVTSAGNPDGYNKGKKAITFAAIGLLIVMSSFALVNTILLAPSGSEKGSTATSGLSSTSIRGVAGSQRFNYLANQIDDILNRVYSSYQLHFAIKQDIENTVAVFTGYDESTCFVPASNCANQVRSAFQSQFTILSNYLGNPSANAKLTTGMAAYLTDVQNEFNSKFAEINAEIIAEDCDTENTFIDGGNPCTPDNLNAIKGKLKMTSVSTMLQKADFLGQSFEEDMNFGVANTAQVFQAISGLASDSIGKPYFDGLIPVFSKNPSGTPPTTVSSESAGYFGKLLNDMKSQLTIGKSLANINQDQIKNVLKSLVEIKSILQNIKFVNTIISADVAQGNAPLIVNFSSVGTTDPSGLTVTGDRLHWDLNGDGKFSGQPGASSDSKCNEQNGAVASCIFSQPGTYRVTLKAETDKAAVNPATGLLYAQEIAPGVSYIDIKVNPPSTKIDLEVSASGSGTKKPILKYNAESGAVLEDHAQVYFTLSQAKAGLVFDASKSTGPDGKSPVINDPSTKIRWNFGVPSEHNDTYSLASKDSLTINQVYPAIGNYQVIFEVTDKNGVVDRKIFTVVVSNVAPSITNPPPAGKVGDELTFDGSDSTSDGGPLIFNWTVEKVTSGFSTAYLEKLFAGVQTAHAA
ncbi:hypothetical protein IT411_00925, partial [Candidatus Peregrinibacteria bacterium]|nr:hypothetical protein [Candidatus Peregrinibacteria bacterium]